MIFKQTHIWLAILALFLFCVDKFDLLGGNEYYYAQQIEDDDTIDFSDPSKFIETQTLPTKEEIARKREIREQESKPKQNKCSSRCDCCWKNPYSPDRISACNAKYKKSSAELVECLHINSKYASDACKSQYGTGTWPFKKC